MFSDDILNSSDMRRAIEVLSRQNNSQMDNMLRQQAMSINGFRDDSDIKRLKLQMEGYEVIIQTRMPRDMPVDRAADQFARQTFDLLRRFPQGWSRIGDSREDNSGIVENVEPESDSSSDRFSPAFE